MWQTIFGQTDTYLKNAQSFVKNEDSERILIIKKSLFNQRK